MENAYLSVITVDRDIENEVQKIPLSNARIVISEKSFLLFNSYFGRNFTLDIQENIHVQFRPAISQSNRHWWYYKKFEEIYREYCKQKNVLEIGTQVKEELIKYCST
ncbi:MAG: hypothetical protein RL660_2795 [Bacteroidota bacterium]